MTSLSPIKPDLGAIKSTQQRTWATGDYARVGSTQQIVGESLCESIDLRPGSNVLDVAAGNGNTSLAAARRFCSVTSCDYVDKLLHAGRRRAEAQGFDIDFQIADAEALPFADESYDVVLSTFGVMFTPDQFRAARELARVCRPGGYIAMTNWTDDGFIGQMIKTIGEYIPSAPGVRSPTLWSEESALEEMFGASVSIIAVRRRVFTLRYLSFDHFIEFCSTWYGPMRMAFEQVGENRESLERDLRRLHARFNVAEPNEFIVPSEYAEVLITK